MALDTTYYIRCIKTLEKAYDRLLAAEPDSIDFELYRSACIKEFEIILELSGKLLKKVLRDYFYSSKAVDKMYFKDLFRNALKHGLINDETCERWMEYRDNRNSTAHDYGEKFAEETVRLLPVFIKDAIQLEAIIRSHESNDQG